MKTRAAESSSVGTSKRRGKPRYIVVADEIADRINRGEFPVGSLLPTEGELCAEYRISRYTVREAIRFLNSLGAVTSRQGQGTRVIAAEELRLYMAQLLTIEDVERHGILTRMVDIRTSRLEADSELAKSLPCRVGQRYLHIECFREPLNAKIEMPLAWNEIFVIEDYAGVEAELGKRNIHVFSLIERMFDEKIMSINQEISGLVLEGDLAARLKVAPGSPGLRLKRFYEGRDGREILIGVNTYPAERFTFRMRLQHRGAGNAP